MDATTTKGRLVVTIFNNEYVDIGDDIRITAVDCRNDRCRLSFEVPRHIRIVRSSAKNKGARHGSNHSNDNTSNDNTSTAQPNVQAGDAQTTSPADDD